MQKPCQLSLHLFRRDLRLQDNTALIEALSSSTSVIPCFIFDPRQLEQNEYRGEHCVAFMRQSLNELNEALESKGSHLFYFHGKAEDVVANLISTHPIDAVYINRDYTPFSIQRDREIEKRCREHHIAFHCYADALLNEPEHIHKADHKPYTIFTPYRNQAIKYPVSTPVKNNSDHYYSQTLPQEATLATLPAIDYPNLSTQGGRKQGLALLKRVKSLENYAVSRDIPALNGTSKLSAHNKFGTISIREFYHTVLQAFGQSHMLLNELYWRDFFTHIGFHFPHVFGHAFHSKYDRIALKNNEAYFKAWCEGRTGFPIVDAGMRELNITGYMHNRVRMITASFLTKDLHIDWRWGEKYFAKQLVDYDPAVNNGNWQWAASTGCDAQPYFRIFNPWLQQQKYDPECIYIKRYLPELADLPPNVIHHLYQETAQFSRQYPTPIVNHTVASSTAKLLYQAAQGQI